MWALLVCSVIALAVFLERLWALRRDRILPQTLLASLERHLQAGDAERAAQLCRENDSALSQVIEAGLSTRLDGRPAAKEAMEERGQVAVGELDGAIGVLSTVAAIAPLLGLLGTVAGMIQVFRDVAGVDNPDIAILARGIWEALLTTGFGLTVAIPTYVAFRIIEAKIARHGRGLEEAAIEVLNALYAPPTEPTSPPSESEAN
jgi:biopolymer transport protein ExbB